jgi:hypothetical protein
MLVKDDKIEVKISATNAYGSSNYSVVGNGAVIWYVPNPPRFLENIV